MLVCVYCTYLQTHVALVHSEQIEPDQVAVAKQYTLAISHLAVENVARLKLEQNVCIYTGLQKLLEETCWQHFSERHPHSAVAQMV